MYRFRYVLQRDEARPPAYTIHKNELRMDGRPGYRLWHLGGLEESVGEKVSDSPRSNIFTSMFPGARDIKERMNKWDYIKLKSFWTAKESISTGRREWTMWENIFANEASDKGFISKIHEELTRLHSRDTNNPIRRWTERTWVDTSPRRTHRVWKDAQHH